MINKRNKHEKRQIYKVFYCTNKRWAGGKEFLFKTTPFFMHRGAK